MAEPVHEVTVRCSCDDVDWCIVGQYIADVRYLYLEAQRRRAQPVESVAVT